MPFSAVRPQWSQRTVVGLADVVLEVMSMPFCSICSATAGLGACRDTESERGLNGMTIANAPDTSSGSDHGAMLWGVV
jgi:hypothetical protein